MDKIIDRAKKFIAMMNNSAASQSETTQAAAHLKKLLDKHNLTMGDVSQEDVSKTIVKDIYDTGYKSVPYEQLSLAGNLARGYGCEMIQTGSSFAFVGPEASALVAKEMYIYISHQLYCLAGVNCIAQRIKGAAKRRYTRTFIIAAGQEIFDRLDSVTVSAETETYEMVRAPAVAEALAVMYPRLKTRKLKGDLCGSGFAGGAEAGKNISLNTQVTG